MSTVIAKSLEEAIQKLRHDPLHPVEALVGDLLVEVRVKAPRSAADLFRELGPWEGESTEELWKRLEEERRRGERGAAGAMRYALDTNAVVAALNGVPPVPARLAAMQATDILLPAPVVAELYFGARVSTRVRENIARVDRLVALFDLQPFDGAAVRRFAEVKADLRRVGRAKSDFDLAIACIALVHGATLVTHDAALLDGSIVGLLVEDWLPSASGAPPRR